MGAIGFRLYVAATAVTCLAREWLLIAVGHGTGELIHDIWRRIRGVEPISTSPVLPVAATIATTIWRFLRVRKRDGTR